MALFKQMQDKMRKRQSPQSVPEIPQNTTDEELKLSATESDPLEKDNEKELRFVIALAPGNNYAKGAN